MKPRRASNGRPARRHEGRGARRGEIAVCAAFVMALNCIYNFRPSCYSLDVEREQTKGTRNEELHPHGSH